MFSLASACTLHSLSRMHACDTRYWGCGAWNTAHHNCFSDMDPGIPDGSWMNFLFQDDASHYLNFSSNVV